MAELENACPAKIHIIGSVGSGKSTLAKALSARLTLPLHELDNIVWIRSEHGDIRRSDEERNEYLTQVVNSEAWIIEGAHHKWVLPSFEKADVIIFLDTSYRRRVYRIIRRFMLQKIGMEKANYNPTLQMFLKMFVWNAQFEYQSKREILDVLRQYPEKLLFLKGNSGVTRLGDHIMKLFEQREHAAAPP